MQSRSYFPLAAVAAVLTTSMSALVVSSPGVAAPAVQSATSQLSWVTLEVGTDKKLYRSGEPIQVKLKATNIHSSGAYLKFTSSQRFDIWIYPQAGRESVYTWSASRMFMQALGSLWLKPAQSQTFDATIGDEMGAFPPGRYRLEAKLTNTTGKSIAVPIYFEVEGSAPASDPQN